MLEDELRHLFVNSLQADRPTREAAESRLALLNNDPQFALQLLRFAVSQSDRTDMGIFVRHATAIYLKNSIARCDWNRNTTFPEETKIGIREALLPSILEHSSTEHVRRQLLECYRAVVDYDWPARWPRLQQQLEANFAIVLRSTAAAENEAEVLFSLVALRVTLLATRPLCKRYEDVTIDGEEAESFAHRLLPGLYRALHLAEDLGTGRVVACGPLSAIALDSDAAIHAALKCLWCLCIHGLPRDLATPEALSPWADILLEMHRASMSRVSHVVEANEVALLSHPNCSSLWKRQKWLWTIMHRILQFSCSTKNIPKRARAAARFFVEHTAISILHDAVALIHWHDDPRSFEFSSCCTRGLIMAMEYVSLAANTHSLYDIILDQHAAGLVPVLLRRLAFSHVDAELWQSNPQEYIRKEADPREDLYNPKKVSLSLLSSLYVTTKPYHSKELSSSFLQHLIAGLRSQVGIGGAPIEAFLEVYGHIARYVICQQSDQDVQNVLKSFVAPHLQSSNPFLRAKALWVLSRYFQLTEWNDASFVDGVVRSTIALLCDAELPVRLQAAVCLNQFIRHEVSRPVVEPQLAFIIDRFSALMMQIDNDSAVRTLRKIVKLYSNSVSVWAVELSNLLVNHFLRVRGFVISARGSLEMSSSDRHQQQHHGGDDIEDSAELDDALQAGDELLETLSAVVRAVPQTEGTTLCGLQNSLSPLFVDMLSNSHDNMGFLDGVLKVLSTLLQRSPVIEPSTWTVFAALHRIVREGATDYFGALLSPLDNFISVDVATFAKGGVDGVSFAEMLTDMCTRVLADRNLRNREASSAPKIMESVFLYATKASISTSEQHCQFAGLFLDITLMALSSRPRNSSSFIVLLCNVVLAAIIFNAASSIDFIVRRLQQVAITNFFSSYCGVVRSDRVDLRWYDRALLALCVASILKSIAAGGLSDFPQGVLAEILTDAIAFVRVNADAHRSELKMLESSHIHYGGGDGDGGSDEWMDESDTTDVTTTTSTLCDSHAEDDDEDEDNVDNDDDDDFTGNEELHALVVKAREAGIKEQIDDGEFDSSPVDEDDNLLDELDFESPIDDCNVAQVLIDALTAVQHHQPSLWDFFVASNVISQAHHSSLTEAAQTFPALMQQRRKAAASSQQGH